MSSQADDDTADDLARLPAAAATAPAAGAPAAGADAADGDAATAEGTDADAAEAAPRQDSAGLSDSIFDVAPPTDDDDYFSQKPVEFYSLQKHDAERVSTPTAPSILEQKQAACPLLKKYDLDADEIWCLIDAGWLDSWKRYVDFDHPDSDTGGEGEAPPGPINNERLLDETCLENFRAVSSAIGAAEGEEGEGIEAAEARRRMLEVRIIVKKGIAENAHYKMVPAKAWSLLLEWYGGFHSGYAPSISRLVIAASPYSSPTLAKPKMVLDVYPYFFRVGIIEGLTEVKKIPVRFSKSASFEDVATVVLEKCLSEEQKTKLLGSADADVKKLVRMWLGFCGTPWKPISNPDVQLRLFDEGSLMDAELFIETRESATKVYHCSYTQNKFYPRTHYRGSTGYGYSGGWSRSTYDYTKNSGDGRGSVPGIVGLTNLGNTCFMNSGMQCLLHTRAYREYFTSGEYKNEINTTHRFSKKGVVAKAFGDLMEMVWSGKHRVVTPRNFKYTIGKFNSTFSGFGQQDSHELVSCVMNLLHEDLNRIPDVPAYTENSDEDESLSEPELAARTWANYKLRNDSVIVDKFHGLVRSELQCPICHGIKVKFDPIGFLSIPIPGVQTQKVNVNFVFHGNTRPPLKLIAEVKKDVSMSHVRVAISNLVDIPERRILLSECFSTTLYTIYSDKDDVGRLRPTDKVYAFELPEDVDHLAYHDKILVPVGELHVRGKDIRKRQTTYTTYYRSASYQYTVIDYPFVMPIHNGVTTGKQIYDYGFSCIRRWFKKNAARKLKKRFGFDFDDPSTLFPWPCQEDAKDMIERNKTNAILHERKAAWLEAKRAFDEREEARKAAEKAAAEADGVDADAPLALPAPTAETFPETWDREVDPSLIALTPEDEAIIATFPEQEDPEKKFLFTIFGMVRASNYHTQARRDDWETILYSDMDVMEVPPPVKPRARAHGYGGYGSYDPTSRNRKYFRFRLRLPDDFAQFFKLKDITALDVHASAAPKKASRAKKETLTIAKCLEKFTEKEILTKENEWYCRSCQEHVEASKKMDIWKLPQCLIIQFKRFRSSAFSTFREKIGKPIQYGHQLDMSPFVILNPDQEFTKYRLYGVSVHGGGLAGGHYTAYARAPTDATMSKWQWCSFNDSSAGTTSSKNAITGGAYLLFYEAENSPEEETTAAPAEEAPSGEADS